MKNGWFIGLGVLLVFSFVLAACSDTGSAPIVTGVITAAHAADAQNWKSQTSFVKGTDISVGVKVDDPNQDIERVGYAIKDSSGNPIASFPREKDILIPHYPYTVAITFSGEPIPVGTYTIEVYCIDSKDNKSNTEVSAPFTITDNAPIVTDVITAANETDAKNWKPKTSFVKGTNISVGVKVDDPDHDIEKLGFSIRDSSGNPIPIASFTGEITYHIPTYPYTGEVITFYLSIPIVSAEAQIPVGTGYTIAIYFIDAKGNTSNTKVSASFTITAN